MPTRDPPQNPSLASAKRAASIGQLSQASSFEEVRLEDYRNTSSDSEDDQNKKRSSVPAVSASQKTEPGTKLKPTGRPPAPASKPAAMHMIDDDNDLIQPNDKKDVSLRELHDPIEGDSADISWRGNSEVKSHAGKTYNSLWFHLRLPSFCPLWKPCFAFLFLTTVTPCITLQLKKPKLMTLLETTQKILIPSRTLKELLRRLLRLQQLL